MNQCCICLDDINENNKIKLKCNHEFHLNCILINNKNSCPLCRQIIIDHDYCLNNHNNNLYFYTPTIKKNGTCLICNKKSLKYYLKNI